MAMVISPKNGCSKPTCLIWWAPNPHNVLRCSRIHPGRNSKISGRQDAAPSPATEGTGSPPISKEPAMKLRHTTLALALACSGIGAAHAEDLMDAYRQARDSDPVLQQAEASRRDVSENVAQARAVLLPQISASGNFSDEHGSSRGPELVGNGNDYEVFTTHNSSRGFDKSATLDQTVFDFGKFASVKAAHAQASSGDAQYQAAQQDLILRTATAYFNVLTAEDELRFAQ